MAWLNAIVNEREGNSKVGNVSVDWHDEGGEYICTYKALIAVADKAIFKANAIAFKDKFIARQSKQDNTGAAILTFMNK